MSRGKTTIAVLYYPAKRGAAALADRFAAAIPRIADAQAYALSLEDTVPAALHGATLAIVVGGDGSILGAARLCAPLGIPLLPVHSRARPAHATDPTSIAHSAVAREDETRCVVCLAFVQNAGSFPCP